MSNLTYVRVAVPFALRTTYSYSIDTDQPILAGQRVRVNFRQRDITAIITEVDTTETLDKSKIKPILEVLDTTPVFSQDLLQLALWAANYYHHPLGEVLFSALPAQLREGKSLPTHTYWELTVEGKGLPEGALKRAKKQNRVLQHLLKHHQLGELDLSQLDIQKATLKAMQDKGLIKRKEKPLSAEQASSADTIFHQSPLPLNPEQQKAVEQIRYHQFGCYLLHGITGSGKTEVYLHIIARALQAGKQALVLIPEIGLSPQTFARFERRFNTHICELHSNISESKRTQNWILAKNGQAKIIIGTRLASLTPIPNLGVIIIDEEHDRSYKQQDSFRYSARDISIYRANKANIPIVLGSATPSLESYANAIHQRYQHLTLTERAGDAIPPAIHIQDLKGKKITAGLTDETLQKVQQTLDSRQQALIFVNRRGYAPALICHTCGWCAQCRHCDTKMTVHRQPAHLRCHHCDRQNTIPKHCPNCKNHNFVTAGFGTEQLELELQQMFSGIEVIRIDRDTTKTRTGMIEKLSAAHTDQPCIFVGTQMLAKGHHLPNLNLVVIVDADHGLLSPDFRGLEQAGQLITQVAGRAGREATQGEVIIQTHKPEHPMLELLLHRGYSAFAKELLQQREQGQLPPYWFLTSIKAESKRAANAVECLKVAKEILLAIQHHAANTSPIEIQLIGPAPAAIEKVNERYRYILHFKTRDRKVMHVGISYLIQQMEHHPITKRCKWVIDVDSVQD
ncbi:Primosomal protein N' [Thalassocella blandensis]|nr:Primosomal protein N' [Thalassocella blandensis]